MDLIRFGGQLVCAVTVHTVFDFDSRQPAQRFLRDGLERLCPVAAPTELDNQQGRVLEHLQLAMLPAVPPGHVAHAAAVCRDRDALASP